MLLDTSAWIELFQGTEKGKAVGEITNGKILYVSILTIAELKLWALRNNLNIQKYFEHISQRATIIGIDMETAILAANIKYESKIAGIGMVDCLIYATAVICRLPVVSSDSHFKTLRNTIMI